MAENKMEQVAALFGKKLGEEFTMSLRKDKYKAKFDNERGLIFHENPPYKPVWSTNSAFLRLLLTGEAVIVDD